MLQLLVRVLAALALSLPLYSVAEAQDEVKLVESIPPEVAEIVTGGGWTEGKQNGFYRIFVLMTGEEDKFGAKLYLQWLAVSEDKPEPAVLKTVPVAEINDRNLENAAIDIDGEATKENEIALVVSSFNFQAKKDIYLRVTASLPGKYAVSEMEAPAGQEGEAGPPADVGADAPPAASGEVPPAAGEAGPAPKQP